jgi:hypothetical protein
MIVALFIVSADGCRRGRAPSAQTSPLPVANENRDAMRDDGAPSAAADGASDRETIDFRVSARALAATATRVEVHLLGFGRLPYGQCVERRLENGEWGERVCSTDGWGYTGTSGSVIMPAKPGAEEHYRVGLDPGTAVEAWRWSDVVAVTMPRIPTQRPAAPGTLMGRPISPYSAELTWEDRSDNEYGFEVLLGSPADRVPTPDRIESRYPDRVEIVAPESTRAVIHGLTPGRSYSFRVRAFNPIGVSDPTPSVSVSLPAGPKVTLANEHMSAFGYGVRLIARVDGGLSDVDYYVMCPGGTWSVAREEAPGEGTQLAPPFGDSCQAWPPGAK